MASLFKPTYTKVDRKTGRKIRRKSRKWYGQFTDLDGKVHRVPLCTDKAAANARLNELVRKAERRMVGLADPFDEHRKRPLIEHLQDFRRSLEVKANTGKHVRQTFNRLRKLCTGCGFLSLNDFSASEAANWLADQREEEMGIKTSNYYLGAVKQFAEWLVVESRLPTNPFAHLSALNADVDVRRERRAADADELRRLILATRQSGEVFCGLSGEDRSMLYLCASYTGLRCSELASLTPDSLNVKGNPPSIAVKAGYSKRRRLDTQPLRPDLAAFLRVWREGQKAKTKRGERLWPGGWTQKAAEMLRMDLAAARQVWLDEVKDEDERRELDESDFLRPTDYAGRVLDFHALRHTFISSLVPHLGNGVS